jgi:membrane-bound ClpP family serine protease
MANGTSSIDYSKFTMQQLEDHLKRPNLSKGDQERLLDELTRRTTEELLRKTQDSNREAIAPPDQERLLETKEVTGNQTSQPAAKSRSPLKRILFFLLASILSFVGIILLLTGLTSDGSTTLYGIACLGGAFWLFNKR